MTKNSDAQQGFHDLPDNPSDEEWDQWLDDNSRINAVDEENLVRYPDLPGNCGSCKWWSSYNIDKEIYVIEDGRAYMDGGTSGTCHRFPPTIVNGESVFGEFPNTESSMGCGEWQLREGSNLADPQKTVSRAYVSVENLQSRGIRHGNLKPPKRDF